MDSEALTGAFRRTAQVGHKDSVPMLAVVDCLRGWITYEPYIGDSSRHSSWS